MTASDYERHEKNLSITARSVEAEMMYRAAEAAGLSFNKWGRQILLLAARKTLQEALSNAEPVHSPADLGLSEDEELTVAGE